MTSGTADIGLTGVNSTKSIKYNKPKHNSHESRSKTEKSIQPFV